jgi:hypothetical protein
VQVLEIINSLTLFTFLVIMIVKGLERRSQARAGRREAIDMFEYAASPELKAAYEMMREACDCKVCKEWRATRDAAKVPQ